MGEVYKQDGSLSKWFGPIHICQGQYDQIALCGHRFQIPMTINAKVEEKEICSECREARHAE